MADRKSYLTGMPTNLHTTRHVLGEVLACMRALQWQYWTAHWQVYGDPSYGDHLMFGRFYEGMTAEIDTLAEKTVGYFGPSSVDPYEQMVKAAEHMARFKSIDCLHRRGLAGEEDLQIMLRTAYEVIHQAGTMTLGLDDYLMSVANTHETNCYLLQQRIRDPKGSPGIEREPVNFELVGELGKTASRIGFNKYNAPELVSQLLTVLKKEGLKDAENQIRMKKIPQLVEKAWSTKDAADRLAVTWFGRTADRPPKLPIGTVVRHDFSRDTAVVLTEPRRVRIGDEYEWWVDIMRGRTEKNVNVNYLVPVGKSATDSGAGGAEGHFFDNPERREVREFHDTGAVSNDPEAAAQAVENMEEHVDEVAAPSGDATSPADAAAAAVDAPPTPEEIREMPGDAAVSTLNRYIVETQEPVTGVPESRDELPKHPEEGAKVGRTWRVIKED